MDDTLYTRRKKAFAIDICIIGIMFFICVKGIKQENLMLVVAEAVEYIGLFFKDVCKGQSVGKRIYKIAVVSENGEPASLKQLILRNVILIVWPVEVCWVSIQGKPRLGDIWAKTKVVSVENRTK